MHFYEGGDMGVEHALLPEKGIVGPGDLIIGADSHTCTYGALGAFATGVGSTDLAAAMVTGEVLAQGAGEHQVRLSPARLPPWVTGKDLILHTIGDIGVDGAEYMAMEFTGEAIGRLSMAERFSMANMAVEAGAKNGIIAPDEITLEYVQGRALRPFTREPLQRYECDLYSYEKTYDVGQLEPQVACPPSPGNVEPVSQVGEVQHRSGGDRLLHQRPAGRPAAGGPGHQGPQGRQRGAPYRHSRHPADLPAGHG